MTQTLAVAFPSHTPRALTGALELGLSQDLRGSGSRPARVTGVLAGVFSHISDHKADRRAVRLLASGAREWLLQRAAQMFWRETGWFQASCTGCGANFDIPARLRDAPRKDAGAGFPIVTVRTSLGQRSFEAPNGGHEEFLARGGFEDAARALVGEIGLSSSARKDALGFSSDDLGVIERALDAACPDIADQVTTHCPTCAATNIVRIDPLDFAFPDTKALLRDVHMLAKGYGWSEDAILELPSARRRAYASMIRSEAAR